MSPASLSQVCRQGIPNSISLFSHNKNSDEYSVKINKNSDE